MSGARGRNPESLITDQIRNTLRLLKIAHWKNAAAPFGEKGIPDIIGVIPGGRSIMIEVKTPKGVVSPEQSLFLEKYQTAGALVFVARSPEDVVNALSEAGYGPAQRIVGQFVNKLKA
jgi:hypothetical protein